MNRLMVSLLACVFLGAAGLLPCAATLAAPAMPTRQAALFQQREAQLDAGIARGDLQVIDSLLSRDFEVRSGAHPAEPIPRDVWLREVPQAIYPGQSSEFSIHSDPGGVLVTFVWAPARLRERFLVLDRWDGADENAHLLLRYLVPLAPGRVPGEGTAPIKPSGKG